MTKMLKINKLTRLLSQRASISSGAEYKGDIVRSLETETKHLQVNISQWYFSSDIKNGVVFVGNIKILF